MGEVVKKKQISPAPRVRRLSFVGAPNRTISYPDSISNIVTSLKRLPASLELGPEQHLAAAEYLASSSQWDFDMFALNAMSPHHSLSLFSQYTVQEFNLLESLNISPESFMKFSLRIESKYQNDLPCLFFCLNADLLIFCF